MESNRQSKKNQSPGFLKCLVVFSWLTQLLNLGIIIAIGAVLWIDEDKSCDQPLALWLEIWLYANAALLIINSLNSAHLFSARTQKIIKNFVFTPIALFSFVWFIIGNVWEFQSETCEDDFFSAWLLTLIILITAYVFVGLLCCGLVFMCACLGGLVAGASSNMNDMNVALLDKEMEKLMKDMDKLSKEAEAQKKEKAEDS